MKVSQQEAISIIEPTSGWKLIDLKELWRYKDLLWFLTLRDIKAKYAHSVLGIGWAIIQPLVQTLIFTVIFGNLAKIESDGIPYALFSFLAMVPWNYFSNVLTDATDSLVKNRNMLSKVYFPRTVLPTSSVLGKLVDFSIGILIIVCFLLYYEVEITSEVLMVPVLILILIMTALGVGMIFSALAVQYRDIKYAMTFMVRILMYSAPVVYPLSIIPDKFQVWYSLNPMVGVIEGFRAAFVHTLEMPWNIVGEGALVALIVFVIGAFYFRRMEKHFADIA